ncbi:MAG: NUDIX hydrolase [Pseudomonadota bacterium]
MMREKNYCPYCGGRLEKRRWEGTERLFCSVCRVTVYENPVPATCLVVADPRDRILFVKRSVPPQMGKWCLPGGFLEMGETPESGALRELKEETALVGKIDTLLGVTTGKSELYDSILLIGYLVINYSGLAVAGDDASEVAYFPITALPEIAFSSHRRFVRIFCAAYAESRP